MLRVAARTHYTLPQKNRIVVSYMGAAIICFIFGIADASTVTKAIETGKHPSTLRGKQCVLI
jgi:hypothetical protein